MAHCALPHEVRQERAERPADLVQLFLKSRYVGVMGVCIFGSEMRPSRFRRLSLGDWIIEAARVCGVKQFFDPSLHRDSPLHIFSVWVRADRCWPGTVVRTVGLHTCPAITPIRIARAPAITLPVEQRSCARWNWLRRRFGRSVFPRLLC